MLCLARVVYYLSFDNLFGISSAVRPTENKCHSNTAQTIKANTCKHVS